MTETTHGDHPPAHEPEEADHGQGDYKAHGPVLGPIDWFAWGAGILGVGAGAVVAACLYVATSL